MKKVEKGKDKNNKVVKNNNNNINDMLDQDNSMDGITGVIRHCRKIYVVNGNQFINYTTHTLLHKSSKKGKTCRRNKVDKITRNYDDLDTYSESGGIVRIDYGLQFEKVELHNHQSESLVGIDGGALTTYTPTFSDARK